MPPPYILRFLLVAAVAFLAVGQGGWSANAERLTRLDGDGVDADVTAIDPDGTVRTDGSGRFVLQQLRSIQRGGEVRRPAKPTATLYPLDAGSIAVHDVSITEGLVKMTVLDERAWALPLRYVRAIRFPVEAQDEGADVSPFEEARRKRELETDRVFAWAKGKLTPVRCIVKSLDAKAVVVEYRGEERSVPRERLAGIVLASPAEQPNRAGHARVALSDESTVWGRVIELSKGVLRLEAFPEAELRVPWSAVRSVTIRSENVRYLSELEPAKVVQEALATFAWPYQRDRNVLGQPLRLGGRKFTRGLGVHARNRLVFDLDDEYTAFAATIGIDDQAGKEGDCVFRVESDGKTLLTKRMSAGDKPERLRVDLPNSRKLVLEVEPGENLDLGDVANWCEARLIRE